MRILSCLLRRQNYSGVDAITGELDSGLSKWSKQYANLPERYLLRKCRKTSYVSPKDKAFRHGVLLSPIPHFGMERPWTGQYWRENQSHPKFPVHHGVYAEPICEKDWMWFRGDRVEILTGKDAGRQGYINYIVQERNWVCVEGLNVERKIVGKTRNFPGLMMVEEQPLQVTTDIKLVDPEDERAVDVEWRYTEDGERVRVSVRSGRELPIPLGAYETVDYKSPSSYVENKGKDTKAEDVEEITFKPKLCTFEMEIMELQGIKEDRIPKKTYWY